MTALHAQFGHPRGLVGALVGHLMAVKNGARSRWVLERLRLKPGESVLEVGFGPGVDVRRALVEVGPRGRVAGVDISEVMVRQAIERNRAAVSEGRATLHRAGVDGLPFGDGEFDAAFAINTAQFWPDLTDGLRALRRVVRSDGRMIVAVQPMWRGATVDDSKRWGASLSEAAAAAGWEAITVDFGPTAPPVAAVSARAP